MQDLLFWYTGSSLQYKCFSLTVAHRLQNTWAQQLCGLQLQHISSVVELSHPTACGILVYWTGIKPIIPALEGWFLPTGQQGKSPQLLMLIYFCMHDFLFLPLAEVFPICDISYLYLLTLSSLPRKVPFAFVVKLIQEEGGISFCISRKRCFSVVSDSLQPYGAYQSPTFMGFSRQEYWSGLSFPSLGDLPNPGIEPRSSTLQTDA